MLLALLACVTVKPYGPTPEPPVPDIAETPSGQDTPAAPQVDWESYQEELESRLESGDVQDQDQRDRLDAAHSLTLALQDGADPELALQDYLDELLEIEARATDAEVPLLGDGLLLDTGVVEEDLPDEVPPPETDTGTTTSPILAQREAREALAEARYADALSVLEPFQDTPHWASMAPLWQEAVDGFVHQERERAGHLFVEARELPEGPERQDAMREVETILVGLVTFYPESSYTEAIRENLALVRAELE